MQKDESVYFILELKLAFYFYFLLLVHIVNQFLCVLFLFPLSHSIMFISHAHVPQLSLLFGFWSFRIPSVFTFMHDQNRCKCCSFVCRQANRIKPRGNGLTVYCASTLNWSCTTCERRLWLSESVLNLKLKAMRDLAFRFMHKINVWTSFSCRLVLISIPNQLCEWSVLRTQGTLWTTWIRGSVAQ